MAKKPARTIATLSKKELKNAKLGKPSIARSAEFDKKPAQSWEDADAEMKKDAERAIKDIAARAKAENKAIPVEDDKPGVARNPKPKKPEPKIAAQDIPLGVLGAHFVRLMERLAAEQGGPHAKALEELRRDTTAKPSEH